MYECAQFKEEGESNSHKHLVLRVEGEGCISHGTAGRIYPPLSRQPAYTRTNEVEDVLLALADADLKACHIPLEGMLGAQVDGIFFVAVALAIGQRQRRHLRRGRSLEFKACHCHCGICSTGGVEGRAWLWRSRIKELL